MIKTSTIIIVEITRVLTL